jgi:hypothetical protein
MTFLKLCVNVLDRNIKIQNIYNQLMYSTNVFTKNLSLCVSYVLKKFDGS